MMDGECSTFGTRKRLEQKNTVSGFWHVGAKGTTKKGAQSAQNSILTSELVQTHFKSPPKHLNL